MCGSLLNILFHFWENKKEEKEGRKWEKGRKTMIKGKEERIMNRHGHDESDPLLLVRPQSSHCLPDCLQLSHAFTLGMNCLRKTEILWLLYFQICNILNNNNNWDFTLSLACCLDRCSTTAGPCFLTTSKLAYASAVLEPTQNHPLIAYVLYYVLPLKLLYQCILHLLPTVNNKPK